MRRLKYVGPHDAVEVPLVDGSTVVVERDKIGEFEDAVAASLVEQVNNWETADGVKPAKSDAPKKPESKTGEEDAN